MLDGPCAAVVFSPAGRRWAEGAYVGRRTVDGARMSTLQRVQKVRVVWSVPSAGTRGQCASWKKILQGARTKALGTGAVPGMHATPYFSTARPLARVWMSESLHHAPPRPRSRDMVEVHFHRVCM